MLPMRPMKLGGDYLIFGENAIAYLGQLEGKTKRAFIVKDEFSINEQNYQEICDYLIEAGFKIDSFSDVESDPSIDTVNAGAKKMLEFEPDWIIAIGGGSVMDAAKAMWIIYEHPELESIKDITNPIPKLRKKAKMVNIPTTSGTGSEVSRSIVISDKVNKTKHGIGDMEMMPDIAILEPKLTVSLPKGMTAATGMDALTHAIEARTSNRSNMISDTLADRAIKEIYENIVTAYTEPDNLKARESMLVASTIAGMAFTNVSLGIVHSIAHSFGGKFGVPHGIANAIILPYVIEFNMKDDVAAKKYQEISKHLGVQEDLLTVVQNLNQQLDIPKTLQEFINDDEAFESEVDEIVALSIADGCTKTNPIIPDAKEFEEIIRVCYYG